MSYIPLPDFCFTGQNGFVFWITLRHAAKPQEPEVALQMAVQWRRRGRRNITQKVAG